MSLALEQLWSGAPLSLATCEDVAMIKENWENTMQRNIKESGEDKSVDHVEILTVESKQALRSQINGQIRAPRTCIVEEIS
jgi:hypothetical protein